MTAGYKMLSLFLVLSFQGCNLWDYLSPPEREPVAPQGSRMEARELLYSYMNARLADESEENLRGYLTEEAWNDYQSGDLNLRAGANREFIGYKIMDESDLAEGRFAFATNLQEIDRTQPQAANITEDLIVSFSDEEYRISSARPLKIVELKGQGHDLIWVSRAEGRENEVKLFNLQDFPEWMSSTGRELQLEAGRAGYATVILNPENRRAALGTTGTHGALGLLSWTGETPDPEQVELTPVDVFYGEHTNLLAFSPDTRYLATEIRSTVGTDRVDVYQVSEANKLNFQLNQAFPPEQYNVSFVRWEPDSKGLLLRVSAGVKQSGEEDKMGTWRLNVQTGEREKVIGG
ncbi:MAG TPA: hypothetical protein DD789_08930 [Firmicutes bacterium]|nr:hypothetical protein [Bacillota bacterium]